MIYSPIYWYEFEEKPEQMDAIEKIRNQIDLNNLSYEVICEG